MWANLEALQPRILSGVPGPWAIPQKLSWCAERLGVSDHVDASSNSIASESHALKHADTSGKKMVCVLGTLAAGAWCAASLAGAGHGVTTAIFMFLIAVVLALVFAALYSYGVAGITQLLYAPDGAAQAAFAKFVTPYMDIWKGFLTVSAWPFFLLYLGFAGLQQLARTLRGAARKKRPASYAPKGPIEGCLGCCVTDEARSSRGEAVVVRLRGTGTDTKSGRALGVTQTMVFNGQRYLRVLGFADAGRPDALDRADRVAASVAMR